MPLVDFIWNYIRDTSDVFSIFSLVKISLTSFLCFSSIFFNFQNTHIYVIKRKLHVGLNIWSLSSRWKKISFVCCAHSWNIFSTWRYINFICSPHRVTSSMYVMFLDDKYPKVKINRNTCKTFVLVRVYYLHL